MPCRKHFLLPVRVLSRLFRRKFIASLRAAWDGGALGFHGKLRLLADGRNWRRLLCDLEARDWVVYAKPPFGGPTQVLKYLARYTHRVAISNQRLRSLEDGKVTFRWKDYAQDNHPRTMTLEAGEFIRRFLLHSLPKGFQRIRQYGFLANRVRREKLPLCRALLDGPGANGMGDGEAAGDATATSGATHPGGAAPDDVCAACGQGRMLLIAIMERPGPCRRPLPAPPSVDTS